MPFTQQVKLFEKHLLDKPASKVFYTEWIGMMSLNWPYLVHSRKAPYAALRVDGAPQRNNELETNSISKTSFEKTNQFLENFLPDDRDSSNVVSISPVHARLFLINSWLELVSESFSDYENLSIDITTEQGKIPHAGLTICLMAENRLE